MKSDSTPVAGFCVVPANGGYTFHLMDRDGARLVIDGIEVARTGPQFAQVCGSPGNAVRYDRGSLGLRAGLHRLHVEALHAASQGPPRLLWEKDQVCRSPMCPPGPSNIPTWITCAETEAAKAILNLVYRAFAASHPCARKKAQGWGTETWVQPSWNRLVVSAVNLIA